MDGERDGPRQLLTLLASLDSHVARFDGRGQEHGRWALGSLNARVYVEQGDGGNCSHGKHMTTRLSSPAKLCRHISNQLRPRQTWFKHGPYLAVRDLSCVIIVVDTD